jgi:acetate kinase
VTDRVLVVNCGSSSVKYQLLDPGTGERFATGLVDRIGRDDVPDHTAALAAVFDRLGSLLDDVRGIGHRVVHGGTRFRGPTLLDDAAIVAIEELVPLAPLHNPVNLLGIRAARRALPDVPQVAVFDTAFHATLPMRAATYAVPASWRTDHAVRKYGFHGTSHAYVSRRTAELLGRSLADTNTIVLHLGNGASACAVAGGTSVDTSMGLTPLAGLVMGTRSGDVDPALPAHLGRVAGLTADDVDAQLNGASGLRGLAGASDLREVTARAAAGDADAELALDVYCYRVRCYVGAYLAVLGRVDAITFTAGVGENQPVVRARSLAGLGALGITVDASLNDASNREARLVSTPGARVAVAVVPTDEEREIASQTLRVLEDLIGRPAGL